MPVVGDERLQEPHRHVDPEAQRYKPLPTAGLMDPDSSRYQHGFEWTSWETTVSEQGFYVFVGQLWEL